jgi:FkbM family methyltransferase
MLSAELAWMRSKLRGAYAAGYNRAQALAQRLIPPDSPLAGVKKKLGVALKPMHRRRLDVLLDAFARMHSRGHFVQIGSNDGAQQDPIREAILERQWRGVMVEPVPYVFERLKQNYGHLPRVQLENVAIAEVDGTKPFYHLPQTADWKGQNIPEWYDALGSFSREVLLTHSVFIPDIAQRIVCTDVPTLTFDSLCKRAGFEQIDLLHIDTEGYDYEILKQIDLDRWRPHLIIYEHHHLGPARAECEAMLRRHGYDFMAEALDTWALRIGDFSERDQPLLEIWNKLKAERDPGLRGGGFMVTGVDPVFKPLFEFDSEDRRRMNMSFDDRTLPALGASVALSPNSPRLFEIRNRYAALDLPVTDSRSQWNKARLSAQIDLLNFRGDNPYVWHYRELPRATRLKFFLYLEYLQRRDTLGLFDQLSEDGMFGCWTHEYAGKPKVSRDLLDSIGELGYLERQLGLVRAKNVRVLDIGAGYGRLAHRMAKAVPGLADYACVDAIPESSFLCEFYTRMRGVTPPVRVVLLDEVQDQLEPGSFDLAMNIHSFSECPEAAVQWWLEQLVRLNVPRLFMVPNEAEGFLSTEPDGSKRDLMPLIERAGYRLVHAEKAIADPAYHELLKIEDHWLLFARADSGDLRLASA